VAVVLWRVGGRVPRQELLRRPPDNRPGGPGVRPIKLIWDPAARLCQKTRQNLALRGLGTPDAPLTAAPRIRSSPRCWAHRGGAKFIGAVLKRTQAPREPGCGARRPSNFLRPGRSRWHRCACAEGALTLAGLFRPPV